MVRAVLMVVKTEVVVIHWTNGGLRSARFFRLRFWSGFATKLGCLRARRSYQQYSAGNQGGH